MTSNLISIERLREISDIKIKHIERLLKVEPQDNSFLNMLPCDIHKKIINAYKSIMPKYVLRNWFPKDKIDWNALSKNSFAIELLKEKVQSEKNMTKEEYNKLENNKKINWKYLSANECAIDILKQYEKDIVWSYFCDNKNPRAFDMIKDRIEYERMTPTTSEEEEEEYMFHRIDWNRLAINENPKIIELVKENIKEIDWIYLASNPNAVQLLEEYNIELYRTGLEENPNPIAIELLKTNPEKIFWKYLSLNPNAIELIKERIKYEQNLSIEEYENLSDDKKIDWYYLTLNSNAIEILKRNCNKICWPVLGNNPNAIELLRKIPEKIFWNVLSLNPTAIELIKERIDYEKSLSIDEYENLEWYKRIDYDYLSENTGIFMLV